MSPPSGLASLRFAISNTQRFLNGQGKTTRLMVELLDAQGQILDTQAALNWSSSRPQDFSVSPDGTVTALVDSGYSEIRVSVPGTNLSSSLVMNVHTPGGGSSSSGSQESAVPVPVLRLQSTNGFSGDTIEISGSGFSSIPADNLVRFGTVLATVTSASANRLTLLVPAMPKGAVNVSIENNGNLRTVGEFLIRSLALNGINPTSATAGNQIVINGEGFTGATSVSFNGIMANFTVNSDNQITAVVPVTATDGVITVSNSSNQISSTAFNVLRIIHVNDDAPGVIRDGFSWGSAYHNLDAALTAATAGDQIWLAAGTYKPSTTTANVSFQMKNNVSIYGGFAGYETDLSAAAPSTHRVILSGDMQNDDNTAVTPFTSATTNSNILITGANNATLSGLTLSGADSVAMVNNNNTSLSLQKMVFEHNKTTFVGSGIYNVNTALTLTDVVFRHNYATQRGGGMFASGNASNVTMTNVSFEQNSAGSRGGGVEFQTGARSTMTNMRFIQNQAVNGAALALFVSGGSRLENAVFEGNTGGGGGSVLEVEGPSGNIFFNQVAVVNNTGIAQVVRFNIYTTGVETRVNNILVANNTSQGTVFRILGGGTPGDVVVQHATLANNTCSGNPCSIGNALTGRTTYRNLLFWKDTLGNAPATEVNTVHLNPLDTPFVDSLNPIGPGGIWFTNDDGFQLKSTTTTAIDAGVVINDLLSDITGRPYKNAPDAGAYEYITP